MQFTFLDMAGKTLFIRDDAERAQWTQEEMTLDLEFPRLEDKVISIGQRIFFKDPTGASQIYEVKQARTLEPDNYQTIVAENICISELSDEHVDNLEIDNKTASNALQGVLNGTLWRVGDSLTNPTSSGDISRGSVWQAVLEIKDNWNVYIEPRVFLNSDGSIARYLDIVPTSGVWNGLRLSIDKNMLDPSVTFDDSDIVTAMYGYGGTIPATTPEGENTECNFKDVVWTATSQHPAKPRGQTYIEDPAATLEYGRNGRARFGFYQNTDITDPNTLLEKTWESLQANSKPAISIDGTVADLYRMGYADKPIKLHDIALVEVKPAGYKDQIQIIRITTDLLDQSATTLTIGSYIPNIVYIERQTNESATGSRGGGGGNKSNETAWKEFRTTMEVYEDGTGMKIRSVQNDLNNTKEEVAVQEAQIEVAYNRITQEVTDRRNADATLQGRITVEANRITQEVTDRRNGDEALSGRITVEANRITQEVTDRTNADSTLSGRITVEANRITQEVTRATTAEGTLSGRITTTADAITAEVTRATTAEGTLSGRITVEAGRITQEVTDRTSADSTLSGRITTEADRISLVVSGTGSSATVNAASIVAGINDAGSSVLISADHIRLSGNTTVSGLLGVENGGLKVKGSAFIQGGLTMGSGQTITASNYYVSSGGGVNFGGATPGSSYSLTGADVAAMLISATVDRNILTIKDHSGNEINFSKATSLSDGWSANTYTVTATQNGVTVGAKSVSPYVQPVSSQGGVYVDVYVATGSSGSPGYETHGTAKKLYLVKNINATTRSGNVELRSENSASSGSVYAQMPVSSIGVYDANSAIISSQSITGSIDLWAGFKLNNEWIWGDKVTISNAYSSTLSIHQQSGYAGATKMVMYYKDNTGAYHAAASGASMAWYYSATSIGNTSSYKTMHYN